MIVEDLYLEKCIGKGGFGEVYLATKEGTKEKYAVKRIDRKIENDKGFMNYFKNEIIVLKNLQHKNIVKFIKIIKTKKNFYIVTEYCNGNDLSNVLKEYKEKYGKYFSEEIVQHLMRQIIDAFKYIHKREVIHRDIKPANILLNYENEEDKKNLNVMKATVKIIDFGFSCRITKTGLKHSLLGSPLYMDPIILKIAKMKKINKLGYDIKADIWSLGILCYELLIGKSTFDSKILGELISKVEEGTYNIPTNLSKEVISFINGMLQYNSHDRLTTLELSNHPFLIKDIKDFHPLDLKKVEKKVDKEGLKINVKKNASIWAIFNSEDEEKLTKIKVKESDEKEKNNNDNKYKGPILPEPNEGIPGNPVNINNK